MQSLPNFPFGTVSLHCMQAIPAPLAASEIMAEHLVLHSRLPRWSEVEVELHAGFLRKCRKLWSHRVHKYRYQQHRDEDIVMHSDSHFI